jgi:hypothetical protein
MKKAFYTAVTTSLFCAMLASNTAIAAQAPVLAVTADSAIESQDIKYDAFEKTINDLLNNKWDDLSIFAYQFSYDQLIEIFAALEQNTSVTSLTYFDEGYISTPSDTLNGYILQNLAQIIETRKNLEAVTLASSNSNFDLASLQQLITALKSNPAIQNVTTLGGAVDEVNALAMTGLMNDSHISRLMMNLFEQSPGKAPCDQACKAGAQLLMNALKESSLKAIDFAIFAGNDTEIGDSFVDAIVANKSLEEITIKMPTSQSKIETMARFVGDSTRLKGIEVSANLFDDAALSTLLKGLEKNNSLLRLTLMGLSFKDKSIATRLMQNYANKSLISFTLTGNWEFERNYPFQLNDYKILATKLAHDTTLQDLSLSGVGLSYEGSLLIADALRTNNTLTMLSLTDYTFGMEGVEALISSLEDNHSLTYMHFFPWFEMNLTPKQSDYLERRLEENGAR